MLFESIGTACLRLDHAFGGSGASQLDNMIMKNFLQCVRLVLSFRPFEWGQS